MNYRIALVLASLICTPAIAQATTPPVSAIPPKYEDCGADCKLKVAKMACGKEDLLATPADVEKMSAGAKDYPSLIAKLGSNCGKSTPVRTRQAQQEPDDADLDGDDAEGDLPIKTAGMYGHHGRGAYQGDRDLLRLKSLGPRGRVIEGRPAPRTAIPCMVQGVRGRCMPK